MAIQLQVGVMAKKQGFTIKSLAERAGVAYNTAHSLYTGRATRIDLDTLERLCQALDAEPGDLLIRLGPQEDTQFTHTSEGSYGNDGDRTTRSSDRGTTGSL